MSGSVLLTGGTGKTGARLAARLRDAGLAHRVASRRGQPSFDWSRRDTWDDTLAGTTSVYLVPPPAGDVASIVIDFIRAAMSRGVGRFVLLSMSSLSSGGPAHGQIHQWLEGNCDDWAVLRPSAFMQNFSEGAYLATIRDEDTIYSNTGTGRVPFIDAADIAHAAFAALTAPTALNSDFVLTGDELLTYDDVAALIATACGRRITHTRVSTDAMIQRFIDRGIADKMARFLAAGYQSMAEGAEDRTTDAVLALTGGAPTRFRAFAEANAGVWGVDR
jgi:ergot alkaloid biosynthesis protein